MKKLVLLTVIANLPFNFAKIASANDPNEGNKTIWQPPDQRSFTSGEKKKECRKYEGKLIAYYGQVYKVEKCLRRAIPYELLSSLTRRRKKIHSVEGDTMIMLKKGEPLTETKQKSHKNCRSLDGEYVTSGEHEIYYVENCQKHPFPDWETYTEHRKKRKKSASPIIELTEKEFSNLKTGRSEKSVLDREFHNMNLESKGIMVIPIEEACRGKNGKLASYYSKLYRIENCKKRLIIEPERQKRELRKSHATVQELTTDQWISIPDGRSI